MVILQIFVNMYLDTNSMAILQILNCSLKQIKKGTEKILLFMNNKYDAILHYLVLKIISCKFCPPLLTH
jgi:hypothetical protein